MKYREVKEKFNRKRALWNLIHKYEYVLEVEKLLEDYVMSKLLEGGSEEYMNVGRKELASQQAKVRETEKMLNYFREL